MPLNKSGIYLFSLFIAQQILCSVPVLANPSVHSDVSDANEEVPSEEFWIYMSEFAEDEDLLDSEVSIVDQELPASSVKVSTEIKDLPAIKMPESSEESL